MTQQVSHRPIKCQSRSWSHRGTKKVAGHIIVTIRSTQTNRDSNRDKSLTGPTIGKGRKVIGVKTMSLGANWKFPLSGVLSVFQNLNYELQRRLVWCATHPPKSSKVIQKRFTNYRRVTRRQVYATLYKRNGTDQCPNGLPNLLAPYREQPRPTRIIVSYPWRAFPILISKPKN